MSRATTPTRALQSATRSIPIVMISSGDPVGGGLVKSLARPGGNITGTASSIADTASKHLDLLHVMLPHASKIAALFFSSSRSHAGVVEALRRSAPTLPVQLMLLGVDSVDEISERLALAVKEKADGLIVVADPRFLDRRQQIAELALAGRIAGTGYVAGYADAGLLIGYGPSPDWFYRRTAYFAARVLKGDSPADIPVEQATEFELVVNLRTARALGIVLPRSMLLQADRVIE